MGVDNRGVRGAEASPPVHPYAWAREMAKSVGLRLAEPLDVSHGINYFQTPASWKAIFGNFFGQWYLQLVGES